MNDVNDFNSKMTVLLLKMLFANQIINHSTYEKILKKYNGKGMM